MSSPLRKKGKEAADSQFKHPLQRQTYPHRPGQYDCPVRHTRMKGMIGIQIAQ